MAKQPKWSMAEVETLNILLDKHINYQEISQILGRTIIGIKVYITRNMNYEPLCLACDARIRNRKGNRLRCKKCSIEHIKKNQREYEGKHKARLNKLRNENRNGGNRELALIRDNYMCQICNKTIHETMLDVHHKDKSGRNKILHNHNLDNLIILCHSCHTKQHKEDTIMKRWKKKNDSTI